MNKIKLLVSLLLTFGALIGSASAGGVIQDGWQLTEVSVASTNINLGVGSFRVKRIFASSDTVINGSAGSNWFVLIDTVVKEPAKAMADFSTSTKRSPALFFPTTATVSNANNPYLIFDYGDDGVIFSSGCFVLKTAASSGEALKVFVEHRK